MSCCFFVSSVCLYAHNAFAFPVVAFFLVAVLGWVAL